MSWFSTGDSFDTSSFETEVFVRWKGKDVQQMGPPFPTLEVKDSWKWLCLNIHHGPNIMTKLGVLLECYTRN